MPNDPDTGAPLPTVTLPMPTPAPAPHGLQEAAERIQKDAEDLKGVVPWLEASAADETATASGALRSLAPDDGGLLPRRGAGPAIRLVLRRRHEQGRGWWRLSA